MTTTYIGALSIGEALPGVKGPLLVAVADLEARIAALASFKATVSLDVAAQITIAEQILASLQAALTLGLKAPSLDVQISAVVALTEALRAQLLVILNLMGLFGAPGVYAWHYNGRADTLGSEMSAELAGGAPSGGGPAENVDALILLTNLPATWAAMSQIFKVAP